MVRSTGYLARKYSEHVGQSTITYWVKTGKLEATRTAGGHLRIDENHFRVILGLPILIDLELEPEVELKVQPADKPKLKRRGKKRLPPGEAAFRKLLRNYKYAAEKRGYKFELTANEFRALTEKVCYYCNEPPSQIARAGNDTYIYNGVDRRDSSLGYTRANTVACCKVCNQNKLDRPAHEFSRWVYKVYQNMFNSGSVIEEDETLEQIGINVNGKLKGKR